jgi:diketogulonate reductase-like aldo/keto reductase
MYRNEKGVCDGICRRLEEDPTKNRREDVFYTTKLLDSQHGYENAWDDIEKCLAKVKQLKYIDLILIHSPQTNKAKRLGTYKALQEAVDKGIVRSIGVSNYGVHHLEELLTWKELKYKPAVNQVELNPWLQRQDIAAFCEKEGILLEAYSPLTQGCKLQDPQLVALAKKYNRSVAQILIRWNLQKGFIPLPKTNKKERLLENYEAYNFELSQSDLETLGDKTAYEYFDWDPTVYRN